MKRAKCFFILGIFLFGVSLPAGETDGVLEKPLGGLIAHANPGLSGIGAARLAVVPAGDEVVEVSLAILAPVARSGGRQVVRQRPKESGDLRDLPAGPSADAEPLRSPQEVLEALPRGTALLEKTG